MVGFSDWCIFENCSFTEPPLLNANHFQYWKYEMKMFLISVDHKLWDVIENGSCTPVKEEQEKYIPKPKSEWNDTERNLE